MGGHIRTNEAEVSGSIPDCLLEYRRVWVCVLLSIATLGVYLVYWQYTLCRKLMAWSSREGSCGGETARLMLLPFYGAYWCLTRGKEMYRAGCRRGWFSEDDAWAYLLLDLIFMRIAALGLMQSEFNRIARRLGASR